MIFRHCYVDVRCDICGQKTANYSKGDDEARRRARSWSTWKIRAELMDVCAKEDCVTKAQGRGWRRQR